VRHRGFAAGLALAALGGFAGPAPVRAQDNASVSEIVVSAEKRPQGVGAPAGEAAPHVVIFHRADNLITVTVVDCDTRDEKDRLAEMKATLRNMIAAAAASGDIELGLESDDVVLPLKPDALDPLLQPGDRDDTTTTSIVVKTHVTATDTLEGAEARIDAFIHKTQVVGRTQVARSGIWQLTLIGPRQYRPQILAAIAEDAAAAAKAFGPGYGVEITGLEHPVAWNRAGPLDLALFIPYALTVEPLPKP